MIFILLKTMAILAAVVSATSVDLTCDAGWFINDDGKCELCPIGHFCANNQMAPCAPGTAQPMSASASCVPCKAGWHSTNQGSTECIPCSRGLQCASATHAIECVPGTYQPMLAQVSCIPCPAGTYQPANGSASCYQCPIGHRCPEGSNNPIPCGPGTYQPNCCSSVCITCIDGTYQVEAIGLQCSTCPPGSACKQRNQQPELCNVAMYNPYENQPQCQQCPDGFYQDGRGETNCHVCPVGHYCQQGVANPIVCQENHTQPLEGCSKCNSCPTSQYTSPGSTKCNVAPPGTRPSSGVCPPGKYDSGSGDTCSSCPEGSYQNKAGQVSCMSCPAGNSCPYSYYTVPINPTQCSPGQYQPKYGQSSCIDCPPGSYCPNSGSVAPVPCVPGTYQDHSKASICFNCPVGTFQTQSNAVKCNPCPPGYVCPAAALPPVDAGHHTNHSAYPVGGKSCGPGTYTASNGSCVNCQLGSYQVKSNASSCLPCTAGSMCPVANMPPQPCSPGYFSSSQSSTACVQCSDGSYSETAGSTKCNACPAGHYCSHNAPFPIPCPPGHHATDAGQKECAQCAPGTYMREFGATACQSCHVGFMCPESSANPTPCPFGTYAHSTGMSSCTKCPSGHYCPSQQMSDALACPAGTYQRSEGQRKCINCPAGYYQPDAGQIICNACPAGSQCLEPTTLPIACPPGHYQSLLGQTSCSPCPYGFVQPAAGSTTCLLCPAGYSCDHPSPTSPTISAQKPCPPGSYSHSGWVECQPVPESKYSSHPGASDPTSCGEGKYCKNSGSTRPTPCPNGNYVYCSSEPGCNPCSGDSGNSGIGSTGCTNPCNDALDSLAGCLDDMALDTAVSSVVGDFVEGGCLAQPELCPLFILGGAIANEEIPKMVKDTGVLKDLNKNVKRHLSDAVSKPGVKCATCVADNVARDMVFVRAEHQMISDSLSYSSKYTFKGISDVLDDIEHAYDTILDGVKAIGKQAEGFGAKVGELGAGWDYAGHALGVIANGDCRQAGLCALSKVMSEAAAGSAQRTTRNNANSIPDIKSDFMGHVYILTVLKAAAEKLYTKYPHLLDFTATRDDKCLQTLRDAILVSDGDESTALISAAEEEAIQTVCVNATGGKNISAVNQAVQFMNSTVSTVIDGVVDSTFVGDAYYFAVEATNFLPPSFTNHPLASDFEQQLLAERLEILGKTSVSDGGPVVAISYDRLLPLKVFGFSASAPQAFKGTLMSKVALPVNAANVSCTPVDVRATTLDRLLPTRLPMVFMNASSTYPIAGLDGYYVVDHLANGPVRYLLTCKF